jgi:hypothetical protein
MGISQSAASKAGSTHGTLRNMLAMVRAQATRWWNLNSITRPDHGYA